MSICKLIFFVPPDSAEAVKSAVFAAGAGQIGAYRKCAWQVLGQGQFLGSSATHPAVGESGQFETVQELRVETICPQDRIREVVAALREAHPYEEPAFDLCPLLDPPE